MRTYASILFLGALVILTSSAHSTTILVPSQRSTIQAGINTAVNGDTVLVAAGIYIENIDFVGKRIVVISETGGASTTIQSGGYGGQVVKFALAEDSSSVLDGFTIHGNGYSRGIYCFQSSPIIQNCEILLCSGVTNGAGIYCGASSAKIRYNKIHSNTMEATGSGICVEGGSTPGVEISYNEMWDARGPGEAVGCLYVTGVYIHHNLFRDNTVGHWAASGVYANGGTNIRIINNTFVNNRHGIVGYASPQFIVRNNIIVGSLEEALPSGLTNSEYNDVWGNGANNYPGQNGISEDPQFTDPVQKIYTLQGGSPCIDAGDPDPAYNDANGTRNDIGAFPLNQTEVPVPSQITATPGRTTGVVYTLTPRISWRYADNPPSIQAGYEIELGQDSTWIATPYWQSGPIMTADSAIDYAGPSLSDHSRYWLRIRVSNGDKWGGWYYSSFRTLAEGNARVPSEFQSIQQAMMAIGDGDTVLVDNGTYPVSLDFKGRPIVLKSENGPNSTIFYAYSNDLPVVKFNSGESRASILDGFSIRGACLTSLISINGSSPTIINNFVMDYSNFSSAAAISSASGNPLITRSVFFRNGGSACIAIVTGQAEIVNNTFDQNQKGITSSGQTTALNNIFSRTSSTAISGTYVRQEFNDLWSNGINYFNGASHGVGNILLDPQFVSPDGRLYQLKVNSPCISAGDPTFQYNDPDGTRNDMGAYPLLLDSLPRAVKLSVTPVSASGLVQSLEPDIAWLFVATSGSVPSGFEIEVGSDDDWTTAELWQTGEVLSDSTQVHYAGAQLANGSTYYLRIRVFDGWLWGGWTKYNFKIRVPRVFRVPSQFTTIQGAVTAATSDDTVLVAPGTYTQMIDFMGKGLVVMSENGPAATILKGTSTNAIARFYQHETSLAVLSGFTFDGGDYPAVWIEGDAAPTITNNIFCNSTANTTIEITSSTSPSITYNIFYNNGGISCIGNYDGAALIYNNTFDRNARGFFSLSGRTQAENNIVTRSTNYGIAGSFGRQSYNLVWGNGTNYADGASAGVGNLTADPQYISAEAREFSLDISSPAIDAGNPDQYFDDADGTRNDMGAVPFLRPDLYVQKFLIQASDPNHVLTFTPTFVWSPVVQFGNQQQAFQISVGTDADWTVSEVWDNYLIYTHDTVLVYAGLPLQKGQRYWARIQIFDGFSWSDWRLTSFKLNALPEPPTPSQPNNYVITGSMPQFRARANADSDLDTQKVEIAIFTDSGLTNLLIGTSLLTLNNGWGNWTPAVGLAENTAYWWSARAWDGYEYSSWAAPARIWYDTKPEPLQFFGVIYPPQLSGDAIGELKPILYWSKPVDPDPADSVWYKLEMATDSLYLFQFTVQNLRDTFYAVPAALQVNMHYWWRVSARDRTGNTETSGEASFWTWTQGDVDLSRRIDLSDLSMFILYLMGTSQADFPEQIGDCTGNCEVDLSDLSMMIVYLTGQQVNFGAPCVGSGTPLQFNQSLPAEPVYFETERLKEPLREVD